MMANVFVGLWNFICRVVGLLIPVGKGVRPFSPAVLWTIHVLVVLLVLVGLYFLGLYLQLERWIPNIRPRELARMWLPLMVLLLYLMGWIGWAVWKVLMSGEEVQAYPDIEQAWTEAVQTLDKAGISLRDVPLYLVVGRTEAPEASLFETARLELTVKQTPRGDAPLHVYATRDAVYVTCARISLLGQYAATLALEGLEEWPKSYEAMTADEPAAATGTLIPGVTERKTLSSSEEDLVAEGRPGSALERRAKRRALNLRLPDLRRDRAAVEESASRLKYLCQLIARDRQPFCPVNGLILLVPFGSTDSDEEARQATEICQRDLATLRQGLKMRCPMFALLVDAETTWGFYEFVSRHKPESKLQRLGQRFPLATDLSPADLREQVDGSVQWMCTHLVPDWVLHLFQVESNPDRQAQIVQGNVRLFRLLEVFHRRQTQLASILKNVVVTGEETPGQEAEPWLFGGLYLAATGADREHEQAFVRGVLDRLNETQEFVAWTAKTVRDEETNRGQAKMGYIALAGLWVVALLLLVWRLFR
jgi:hypothetical protein